MVHQFLPQREMESLLLILATNAVFKKEKWRDD